MDHLCITCNFDAVPEAGRQCISCIADTQSLRDEAKWVLRDELRVKQIGGSHYKKHVIQPWDVIDEYGLDFYEGNALKYLLRDKGDRLEDLKKAQHYLEKKIELLTTEKPE